MGNMAWLRLEEEEQVAVLLRLLVVGKEAFLEFEAVSQVVGDFILLQDSQYKRGVCAALGAPLPMPCGSGSAGLFASRDSAHPFPGRSSSWTATRSWP